MKNELPETDLNPSSTQRCEKIRVSVFSNLGEFNAEKHEIMTDFVKFSRRRVRASPMRSPAKARSFCTFMFKFVEVKPHIAIAFLFIWYMCIYILFAVIL